MDDAFERLENDPAASARLWAAFESAVREHVGAGDCLLDLVRAYTDDADDEHREALDTVLHSLCNRSVEELVRDAQRRAGGRNGVGGLRLSRACPAKQVSVD